MPKILTDFSLDQFLHSPFENASLSFQVYKPFDQTEQYDNFLLFVANSGMFGLYSEDYTEKSPTDKDSYLTCCFYVPSYITPLYKTSVKVDLLNSIFDVIENLEEDQYKLEVKADTNIDNFILLGTVLPI